MSSYRELADRLRDIQSQREVFCCGKVVSVDGLTCMVEVGSDTIEVSLRPTELAQSGELLIVPKVGSAVVCGCVEGDYSRMVILAMDVADQIMMTGKVVINGGGLGGLVNIAALTGKLNELVDMFNAHTHTGNMGAPTSPPTSPANSFAQGDYEDKQVTH